MPTYEYGKIAKLAVNLEQAGVAPDVIAEIMAGGEEIRKGDKQEKKAGWLREAMLRLNRLLDKETRLAVREGCACCLRGKRLELSKKIAKQHEQRYFVAPVELTVADAPFQGMPGAPVVLVEFFDYDCYYCRMFVAMLEEVLARFPSEVRIHYKNFPLSTHPESVPAAIAAVAAGRQGRFLEMHRMLFANQGRHSSEDLYSYARAIGLDVSASTPIFAIRPRAKGC